MAHIIFLQAYGHKLPHYVSLRVDPKIIEQIRKIQEKLQQLENPCAKVTNGLKKFSADLKKISAVIHNRENEQFHKNVEKQKDEKCCNSEKAVSYTKGKSCRTSMEKSIKYIPPPMRKKGKQPTNIEGKKEEKCWKCGDKYFTGHKCAFYTKNIIASNSKKAQKDDADSDKNNMEECYHEQLVAVNLLNAQAKEAQGCVEEDATTEELVNVEEDTPKASYQLSTEKKESLCEIGKGESCFLRLHS